MPFRVEKRDVAGTGKYTTFLISYQDDEGNSMRVGHLILPTNVADEFAELFKSEDD